MSSHRNALSLLSTYEDDDASPSPAAGRLPAASSHRSLVMEYAEDDDESEGVVSQRSVSASPPPSSAHPTNSGSINTAQTEALPTEQMQVQLPVADMTTAGGVAITSFVAAGATAPSAAASTWLPPVPSGPVDATLEVLMSFLNTVIACQLPRMLH